VPGVFAERVHWGVPDADRWSRINRERRRFRASERARDGDDCDGGSGALSGAGRSELAIAGVAGVADCRLSQSRRSTPPYSCIWISDVCRSTSTMLSEPLIVDWRVIDRDQALYALPIRCTVGRTMLNGKRIRHTTQAPEGREKGFAFWEARSSGPGRARSSSRQWYGPAEWLPRFHRLSPLTLPIYQLQQCSTARKKISR